MIRTFQAATLGLALFFLTPYDRYAAAMLGREQKDFSEQLGLRSKPLCPTSQGVVADWTQLPPQTQALRRGWSYLGSRTVALDADAAMAEWVYEKKQESRARLIVQVVIFSAGQAGAVAHMDAVGHSSNMAMNPFGPAPESMKLGDFTAVGSPERAAKLGRTSDIFWVYRNAFGRVRVSESEGVEVLPLARALQSFMERYEVKDLPAHVPKVRQMNTSPSQATVGQQLRIAVVAESMTASSRISIHALSGELKFQSEEATNATYLPEAAGKAVLEAVVFDTKTLLSARQQLLIEIAAVAAK